jgi:hypothetical protein
MKSSSIKRSDILQKEARLELRNVRDDLDAFKLLMGDGVKSNLDSLSLMSLAAGLGALTGATISMDGQLSTFTQDLQDALKESSKILKEHNIKVF